MTKMLLYQVYVALSIFCFLQKQFHVYISFVFSSYLRVKYVYSFEKLVMNVQFVSTKLLKIILL